MGIPTPGVMPSIDSDKWYFVTARVWENDYPTNPCVEIRYVGMNYNVMSGVDLNNILDWSCIWLWGATSSNIVSIKGPFDTRGEAEELFED